MTNDSDEAAESDVAQGRAFFAAGNLDASQRAAERALGRNPHGFFAFSALDLIGDVAYARSDYDRQLQIADDLLARDPERIEGHLHRVFAYVQQGKQEPAKTAIEEAMARFPQSANLAHMEARRLWARGDHHQAVTWAETAVSRAPTRAVYQATLAACLSESGRRADCDRVLADALAAEPMDAYVNHLAALIAYDRNNYAAAMQFAEAAVVSDPTSDSARTLAYKARRFKHPLLKPYWVVYDFGARRPWTLIFLGWLAMVLLAPLQLSLPVAGLFLIYYMVCVVVMRRVEALAKRSRNRPPPRLRDF